MDAWISVQLPIPSIDEPLEIVAAVKKQLATLSQLQSQAERVIDLLQERRTALISAAVTGKIDDAWYRRCDISNDHCRVTRAWRPEPTGNRLARWTSTVQPGQRADARQAFDFWRPWISAIGALHGRTECSPIQPSDRSLFQETGRTRQASKGRYYRMHAQNPHHTQHNGQNKFNMGKSTKRLTSNTAAPASGSVLLKRTVD